MNYVFGFCGSVNSRCISQRLDAFEYAVVFHLKVFSYEREKSIG